ncbi:MAG: hypothetical protein AAGA73_00245 [Pseudomonadota bacterium]
MQAYLCGDGTWRVARVDQLLRLPKVRRTRFGLFQDANEGLAGHTERFERALSVVAAVLSVRAVL